jgi:hypothetical protein
MKKNKGNEHIGAIIQTHMEISQGNSLYSYLYLKQAKMSFLFFFLLQNQRTGGQNRSCLGWRAGCWYQWERKMAGKRVGR